MEGRAVVLWKNGNDWWRLELELITLAQMMRVSATAGCLLMIKGLRCETWQWKERRRDRRWLVVLVLISGYIPQAASSLYHIDPFSLWISWAG